MSNLYRAAPDGLIQHPLDSMTLLFQRSSGITHMVADPVPAIMEVMETDCVTANDVVQRLALSYDMEVGMETIDIVLARLEELCALGLVERV
ncbi:HPr-rel-A system PqqD family peptide chaperone [Parasphingorhabdus sp. JC815]|uniref:HPr-rel-A system PqqD family peptide chaperone n=1 Tax=Parasphingorhabdus sp. JC815 TaxID=3232140 RepID=UPI0034591EA4